MIDPLSPQAISDYKRDWMMRGPVAVTLHSDLRSKGQEWCKNWLNPIHWRMVKYTDNYEDTFYFEKMSHAKGLLQKFPEYTKLLTSDKQ